MKHIKNLSLLTISFYLVLFSSSQSFAEIKKQSQREALLAELTGKNVAAMNDSSIYAEVVGAYQSNDSVTLKSRLQSLLKRYPQSEYADNALYLAGRNAMEQRNYADALKYFSQVIERYPNGNKVVSAQFAKAMTYRKMNLDPMAKQVLADLKKKYPGSPESFRADNELKMIK